MVHASLRAVGPVAGGAAGVLEALGSAVRPSGTLLMNLGAREEPDAAFDKDRTPADPDVGMLAEVFRQLWANRRAKEIRAGLTVLRHSQPKQHS